MSTTPKRYIVTALALNGRAAAKGDADVVHVAHEGALVEGRKVGDYVKTSTGVHYLAEHLDEYDPLADARDRAKKRAAAAKRKPDRS